MQNYLLVVIAVTLSLTNMCYADVPNSDRLQSDIVQNHISDGNNFIDKENYLAAVDAYRKALALDPQNGNAYAGLGTVEYIKKNFRKAIESFEKAEEYGVQGSWFEGTYAHHGFSLLELGENDKAIEVFEKLKAQAPQNLFAYRGLSTAYLRSNNMEEFIKNAEKMVELKPDGLGYFALANGYLQIKNYDKARENYLKARELAESTADTGLVQFLDPTLGNIPK